MYKRFRIIQTYWFIIAVLILVLNDFIFKPAFHNWFTGKLSDFAGVFILPLFLATLFPKHIKICILLTLCLFTFWKSPFSSELIHFINYNTGFNYVRIIDYSDLIAFSILPLAYYVYINVEAWNTIKISPVLPFLLATFALLSTSNDDHIVELNQIYSIEKNIGVISTEIDSSYNFFLSNGLNINVSDSAINDTIFLEMTLTNENLQSATNIYGSLIDTDSNSTYIFFDYFSQYAEFCLFRKCSEPDDKIKIINLLEAIFIDEIR